MGNCNFKSENEANTTISKNNFQFHYVIGRGGFGKVWKVEQKKTKNLLALKEMSKIRIITKKSVNSVMNERHLLSILRHPFLVNMNYAFQDRENLYLAMDLMSGGDLRYHINRIKIFSEEQSKFFIICMLIGLEYLHSNGILHRDIKPENLVFDNKGYLRITDLGIARIWKEDNASETSGTPGYMAPEVMCKQNHGVAVDYYAVGVLTYELMMGKRPYMGKSRKEIRDQILAKQVQIKKNEIPEGWSLEAADFVNRVSKFFLERENIFFKKKLIQRKPINRLGLNGPQEVKQHPWIKSYSWDNLINKLFEAPYIPNEKEDNFDLKHVNNEPVNESDSEINKQTSIQLRRNSVQNLFEGYDFDSPSKNVLGNKNSQANRNTQLSTHTQMSSNNK